MKVISKEDLMILLPYITNKSLDLNDFESLLEGFGDDYFVEDGEFVKTKENQSMKYYREQHNLYKSLS